MIKIFTDSTSYIPSDIQLEYGITAMPVSVIIDGKTIHETDISNDTFYALIRKNKNTPKSLALQADEIAVAFEKEVADGHTILAIMVSSKISDTYKNACTAKDKVITKYPKASITIIDSKSGGMQEGLAVLTAAQAVKDGGWLEDIIKKTDNTIRHTKFLFIPDTLKFLEIGGRISITQLLLGSALQITPILTSKNGEIIPLETIRIKDKALERMVEIFKNDVDEYGVDTVIIHHIDAIDKAVELAKQVEKIARVEVSICDIGPAIGANVGPGAIGIVYKTIEQLPTSN